MRRRKEAGRECGTGDVGEGRRGESEESPRQQAYEQGREGGSEGGAGDGAGAWMGENWEKGSRARQSLGYTLQLSCGECTRVNTCIAITVKNLFNLPFHLPLIKVYPHSNDNIHTITYFLLYSISRAV